MGLPTSATAAIMLAAFRQYGIQLGPLAETSFRNALLSSGGEYSTLVASPITWVLYCLMAIVLAAAGSRHYSNARRNRTAAAEAELIDAPIADREDLPQR